MRHGSTLVLLTILIVAAETRPALAITVRASDATATRAATTVVSFSLDDLDLARDVVDVGLDVLFDLNVFEPVAPSRDCRVDERLGGRVSSLLALAGPAGKARLRLHSGSPAVPPLVVTGGPLFRCSFRVRRQAPLGETAVVPVDVRLRDRGGNAIAAVTQVGTVSVGVELTPTPTPTATIRPTETVVVPPTVVLEVSQEMAPRGGATLVVVALEIEPPGAHVVAVQTDVLLDRQVFEPLQPALDCWISPDVLANGSGALGIPFGPVDPERERLRMFVISHLFDPTPRFLFSGETFFCELRVRADAPLGPSALSTEMVEASDEQAHLLASFGRDGVVTIEEPSLPIVRIGLGSSSAPRGSYVDLAVFLEGAEPELLLTHAEVEFPLDRDLFLNSPPECRIDERLPDYAARFRLTTDMNGVPRAAVSAERTRPSPDFLTDGPLLHCRLRVLRMAPLGTRLIRARGALTGPRVPARPVDGSLEVVPALTATPTASRSPSATRTSRLTPSATPTLRPVAGDCNGDLTTGIAELQICLNLFFDPGAPTCPACDVDGNAAVGIADLQAPLTAFFTR